MTERYGAYTVVLDQDTRNDDAESITKAIMMVRGVKSVTPIVADSAQHIAEMRVTSEVRARLYKLAQEF